MHVLLFWPKIYSCFVGAFCYFAFPCNLSLLSRTSFLLMKMQTRLMA